MSVLLRWFQLIAATICANCKIQNLKSIQLLPERTFEIFHFQSKLKEKSSRNKYPNCFGGERIVGVDSRMSKITSVLRHGKKTISFIEDCDLLDAIGQISGKYDEITAELGEFKSPEALINTIADGVNDPALYAAMEKLGLKGSFDKVKKHIGKIEGLAEGKLKPYLKLVTPVNLYDENAETVQPGMFTKDDDGLVAWNILSATKALSAGQKKQIGFNLGANATVEFEAGDAWPYDNDRIADPLLRIGFDGKAESAVSGKLPFKLGFVAANSSVEANLGCEFYFDTKGSKQIFALALADRLPRIPSPFDFNSLWDAFADPNAGLAGIKLAYGGHIDLEVEVGIGKKFSFADGIEVGGDLSIKVGVKRPGDFELTMRAGAPASNGGRTIITTLSRGKTSQRNYALGLGLELDLSGLATRIHGLLSDALGHWKVGLDKVQPFLSPGSLLKAELEPKLDELLGELISDDTFRVALSNDLQIALGNSIGRRC